MQGANNKTMSSTSSFPRSIVPLIEGTHDDLQVVRLGGDQFLLTAQQAIDACSLAANAVRFQAQFSDLLDVLYDWVEQRKDRVSAAYISVSHQGLLLLIVQREIKANFDLENELVELDLEIANNDAFDLVAFNTLLVPRVGNDVLKSFLSTGQIVGHGVNAKSAKSSRHGD